MRRVPIYLLILALFCFNSSVAQQEKAEHGYERLEDLSDIMKEKTGRLHDVRSVSSERRVDCSSDEQNHVRICTSVPSGSQIVRIAVAMRNSAWVGGGQQCRSDLGSTHYIDCATEVRECGIGWAKVRELERTTNSACANFHNWRHDNHRYGRITIYYTP